MLLPSKDGIKCDRCGKIYKSKFVYFSYDCHKVIVDVGRMESTRETATDVNGSVIGFDICEICHNEMIKLMLENQK